MTFLVRPRLRLLSCSLTLGRIAARSLELVWSADKMRYFYDKLVANLKNGNRATANTKLWKPESWPNGTLRGVGFTEAPRGALGHWITIKDRKIENYQCVVPTTWNGAPAAPTDSSAPMKHP